MKMTFSQLAAMMTNEDSRQHIQFICVYAFMAFIATFMTVMNFITGWRDALMHATLYFALLNILNIALELVHRQTTRDISRMLFAIEIIALFTFFILNGQPKGFSALWSLLMPSCGLLLYKSRKGAIIAGIQLAIILFLFYTPTGNQMLNFEYTDVFLMRFPVLYTAFFMVGLFFEQVRSRTQMELSEARDKYQELYAREEDRANREKEVNYRIMQVLADEYRVVLSINLESGKMSLYSGQEYLNPALANLPFQSAVALYRDNVVSAEYRDEFGRFLSVENIRQCLESDTSAVLTYAIVLRGNEHYLQAKIVKVPDKNGEFRRVLLATSDADAYIREQQQIQHDLREQRRLAEDASKAKTDFLFNMSHDIRTPMNAILGFTDIATDYSENPEKVRENLHKVRQSGDMLLSLINNMLDMSRIESGKVVLNELPTNLMEVFEDLQSVMGNMAQSKDIRLSFDTSGIADRYIYADKARVERILVNLISNAVKYTDVGGQVQVSCEQQTIRKPGYATYRFMVKDNGIGMSDDFQQKMFDEFAREESSHSRGIQGTGLGLPLAKKLTEIMGGTIACESKQGIGTAFFITLSFRLQTAEDIEAKNDDTADRTAVDLCGKKVLIVEDNELNREIETYILQEKGMITETAVNGKEAVKTISARGIDYYDLVLMDIQMPIMDGYEATGLIRKLYPEKSIPIIALSANAFEEDKQKSRAAGMNAHVAKPIDIDELTDVIAGLL